MEESLLEKLGLTKGEIKVYLALNKIGESTVGPIGSESGVSKSKIYDILEKLIDKGLVGYIIKDGVKYFLANDPHVILDYMEKKENELGQIKKEVATLLPQLMLQRQMSKQKRLAEMYEGFQGMKSIREELTFALKDGEEFLVLGAPSIANDKWEAWILEYHKKRQEKKIKFRIIYNSDARKYGVIRSKMKYSQVKYLPNDLVSPHWIDIFPEAVLFVILLKEPVAFVIRDKEFAKGFISYFELMWKSSVD